MKVFNDLKLVEQMGTGIIRILESYNKDVFEFFPNFIRVTFPYSNNAIKKEIKNMPKLSNTQSLILKLIKSDPTITQEKISQIIDINIRTVQRNIKTLYNKGILTRNGATKKSEWIIKKI